ncbi:MAG: M24 family metallopeptidase [Candidatus Methanospirareceae archaeon]
MYPKEKEYEARLDALRKGMDCEVGLLLHSRDIYYFAGTTQPSLLLVFKDQEPIIIFRMNYEKGKEETWIADARSGSIKDIEELIPKGVTIGIEKDVIPAGVCESILRRVKDAKIVDISSLILQIRMLKSPYEIKMMEEAARISNAGHERLREVLSEGMREIELAAEVEYAMRKAGHEGLLHIRKWDGFLHYGMVSSGENLCSPSGFPGATITGVGMSRASPYGASPRRIKRGDLVMADIGGVYHGYHSDEARMYVVGEASEEQIERYEILLEIQKRVIPVMKPGRKVSEVYDVAFSVVNEYECAEWFMGYWHYGVRYLGHGVGLELDEPPLVAPGVNIELQEGMVLALEPKLIIPGWGGLDLEDTFLITDSGGKHLTYSPRELIIV